MATGLPWVHCSWVQSCSTYWIGCSALSPTIAANPCSTASRRFAADMAPKVFQVEPPTNDSSTPTEPSGGELSNDVRTAPFVLSPEPDRPAFRQNGVS